MLDLPIGNPDQIINNQSKPKQFNRIHELSPGSNKSNTTGIVAESAYPICCGVRVAHQLDLLTNTFFLFFPQRDSN
jgi:hypothetical protein